MTTETGNKCDGYACSPPKECCKQGCCFFMTPPNYKQPAIQSGGLFNNPLFLGHWYFWLAVTATVAGILCACSLWKKHSQGRFCCKDGLAEDRACSEPDSNGSCYLPPQYSRCNSFHQPPPPYSEVASKPDLYPLVISYNSPEPIAKHNNPSTGYLMVQYFRNFIVRPVESLSAASTNDSISSSFLCNVANEANTIIPPPYSNVTSLEELVVMPQIPVGPDRPDMRIPMSTSSISNSVVESQQVSAHTQIEPEGIIPATPSTNLRSPARSSQQFLVQVRDNPCFVKIRSTTSSESSKSGQTNQNEANGNQSNRSCPPPPPPSRRSICSKSLKEQSQDSTEDEDKHNFSDLLNLSVCVPHPAAPLTHHFQGLNFSVTNSMTGSDISSIANLDTPDSPPRATSPTVEMKELLDKIQQLPQQKSPTLPVIHSARRKAYFHNVRSKTLYMPLGEFQADFSKSNGIANVFSSTWLSRSAPCTPCGNVVPSFPVGKTYHTTGSKSKLSDGSPLLREDEEHSDDEPNKDECL